MDNTAAKTRASYRSAVLVCVVAIGAAAAGLSAARLVPQDWRVPLHSGPLKSAALFSRGSSAPASFADVVDAVKPAVVGVKTKRSETEQLGSLADRFSHQFGAPPLTPETPGSHHPPRTVTTQGSGFFISADGYAVTNNHVVEGSEKAEIQTDDQKTYTAKVVGSDPISDLALLKVDGRSDFAFVKLVEQMPRVGDWVLAIGNPFGLGGTVTAGIVSARERNIGGVSSRSLLRIHAPLHKGDSGGPTF